MIVVHILILVIIVQIWFLHARKYPATWKRNLTNALINIVIFLVAANSLKEIAYFFGW